MRYKIKNISTQKGFTILETLIVLSVTGILFISTSLLIRGQIERTRYQDSMRQLQQMVQNSIDDTANGIFGDNNGSSPIVFAGKRISFCDGDSANNTAYTTDSCSNPRTQYRVENRETSDGSSFVSTDTQYYNLPAGIEYKGWYFNDVGNSCDGIGGHLTGSGTYDTGYMVRFTKLAGSTGLGVFSGNIIGQKQDIQFYDYWGSGTINNANCQGQVVCFSGYKNGSVTIGRNNSLQVDMQLDDSRCGSL